MLIISPIKYFEWDIQQCNGPQFVLIYCGNPDIINIRRTFQEQKCINFSISLAFYQVNHSQTHPL